MDYYLPGHKSGGPLRSVSNLVASLGGEFEFCVVTRDRDLGDAVPYDGVRPGVWQAFGGGMVLYASPGWRTAWGLFRLLRGGQFHLVYLNSFFSRLFSMFPVWLGALGLTPARRFLLAPRGEFGAGALSLKARRKRIYLGLIHVVRVYRDVLWHASSDFEASEIRQVIGQRSKVRRALPLVRPTACEPRVLTALDMPVPVKGHVHAPGARHKQAGHLDVVFLSRISRQKNLLGALEILAGVTGRIDFHIYGPKEEAGYWERCRRLIGRLPVNIRVHDHGPIPHHEVVPALESHDVFFLPTFGENFGHVFLEALLAGCPLLISDRTPWRQMDAIGAGWDFPLERVDLFQRTFETLVQMGPAEFARMSARARDYGWTRATDRSVLEDNRQLFLKSLAG